MITKNKPLVKKHYRIYGALLDWSRIQPVDIWSETVPVEEWERVKQTPNLRYCYIMHGNKRLNKYDALAESPLYCRPFSLMR